MSTNGDQGLFFIPLQSTNSSTIQSYITAYKHNDSLYTYKLYNKDSLNNIHPTSNVDKFKLLNTQAMLGVFEKSVNQKDSINVIAPTNGIIKNANVIFNENAGNVVSNTTNSTSSCEMKITISVTYEWRDYVYCYGGSCGSWFAVSVSMTIDISCDGGGGGGSGTGGSGTGGSGTGGSGTGGSGTSGNNNYWWYYGSGWPYLNSGGNTGTGGPNASLDPNWDWWWTLGGGPGGSSIYSSTTNTLTNQLGLSFTQSIFLEQNQNRALEILTYLQHSQNPQANVLVLEHLNRMINDQNYFIFVSEHSITGNPQLMWWEDYPFLKP